MLNATVGVRRIMSRLRPTKARRPVAPVTLQRRSVSIAGGVRAPRSFDRPRLSGERLVSLTAVGLVAAAVALSNLGADTTIGATGNTSGAGSEPRIAVGGAVSGLENAPQGGIDNSIDGTDTVDGPVAVPPDGNVSMDHDLVAPTVLSPTIVA